VPGGQADERQAGRGQPGQRRVVQAVEVQGQHRYVGPRSPQRVRYLVGGQAARHNVHLAAVGQLRYQAALTLGVAQADHKPHGGRGALA